jgi:class 3 adenylate cyclase
VIWRSWSPFDFGRGIPPHLRFLVDTKMAEHRGRVVKNTGDWMLAKFSSVVDAVRCAVGMRVRAVAPA